MYNIPLKGNDAYDHEQVVQAYDKGYEDNRQQKAYTNPWQQERVKRDLNGVADPTDYVEWEAELNTSYYLGYYDWESRDWVPWLKDEEQHKDAINPRTGKSRKKSLIRYSGEILIN